MKVNLTVKVDSDIRDRLAALSVIEGRSWGELIRRALRSQYGIASPGQALAAALCANAGAPWLNRPGGAEHGA
jgi:hypothetical protein